MRRGRQGNQRREGKGESQVAGSRQQTPPAQPWQSPGLAQVIDSGLGWSRRTKLDLLQGINLPGSCRLLSFSNRRTTEEVPGTLISKASAQG